MADPKFAVAYRKAMRPGWYCRVLHGGEVAAGASIIHEPFAGERITMVDAVHDYYLRTRVPAEQARRYLQTPAHEKTHRLMQEILERG